MHLIKIWVTQNECTYPKMNKSHIFHNQNSNFYPLWNIIWRVSIWFEHGCILVRFLTPFYIKQLWKEFSKCVNWVKPQTYYWAVAPVSEVRISKVCLIYTHIQTYNLYLHLSTRVHVNTKPKANLQNFTWKWNVSAENKMIDFSYINIIIYNKFYLPNHIFKVQF